MQNNLKYFRMNSKRFLYALQNEVKKYNSIIATKEGDWIVKGFIDIYKNIYTITLDTKVVSKVLEILLIPQLDNFAKRNNLILILPPQQNFYPDLTFISTKSKEKFAVDIKSTYKNDGNKIKSMTLGAFTGYFRNRDSKKNITYPYNDYSAHLVLGVIYSQTSKVENEKRAYSIAELDSIKSVIRDFKFFVQPKFKIASSIPGSGNTKNIGSTNDINKLIKGEGEFAKFGESVFDDYWMYYCTNDMAKALEIPRPYTDLKSYFEYKKIGFNILKKSRKKKV